MNMINNASLTHKHLCENNGSINSNVYLHLKQSLYNTN